MSKTNVKKSLEFQGKKRQLLLSRKSMHLIRIEINDKKYALISTMKIKNALELSMGVGGGGEGGGGGGGGAEEGDTVSSVVRSGLVIADLLLHSFQTNQHNTLLVDLLYK